MTSTTLQVGSHSPNDISAKKPDEVKSGIPQEPSRWYGIVLAAIVAVIATVLGGWLPTIGGPGFAILLGLGIRNTIGVLRVCQPGLSFASQAVLVWSLVLLGFRVRVAES